MKKTTVFISLVTLSLNSSAQTLTPPTVSGGGAYYQQGSYSLSVTMGELMAVQTLSSGGVFLTQGFQQPVSLTALPVSLLFFNVVLKERRALLSWKTTREINNDHFDVERSPDGLHYTRLTTIAGHGNSSTEQFYEAVDANPYEGITYYRLKQVDLDGHWVYSPLVSVRLSTAFSYMVYPNPAMDKIYITVHSAKTQAADIDLYDAAGKLVQSKHIDVVPGDNKYEWTISMLSHGLYFISSKNIDIPVSKIIKQ
jgi:hypothetical protein